MTASAQPTKKTRQMSSSFWRRHPRRTVAFAIAGFLVLWLLGAPQHSYYFLRCGGHMPVRYMTEPFPQFWFGDAVPVGYMLPTDKFYYDPPYLWTTTFYCSEQQAIDDGLKPDALSNTRQRLPSTSIYRES